MKNAINLVLVIGHLIAEQRPDLAKKWFDTAPVFPNEHLHRQVVEINRYWREQFGMLECDTIQVRRLLNDNTEPQHWLENFKEYVIPAIIANDLPDRLLFQTH